MKNFVFAAAILSASACTALAQGNPTISRVGDLQIGGGYTSANSDYLANRIRGFGFYSDFDFHPHFGVEVDFHHVSDPNATKISETTYEIGGRYMRRYGRLTPYGKALIGRGVFNYGSYGSIGYNMYSLGGGVDIAVHSRINVRADYEYQIWTSFPPNGLTPSLITVGVAYHFPGGNLSAR